MEPITISSNKKHNLLYSPSSTRNSNLKQGLSPQSQSRSSSQSSTSHVPHLKMGAAMTPNQSFERYYAGSAVLDHWRLQKITEYSFPPELVISDQFKTTNDFALKDHQNEKNSNSNQAGSSLAATNQRRNHGFVDKRSKTATKVSRSSRQKTTEGWIVNFRHSEAQIGPSTAGTTERAVKAMNQVNNHNKSTSAQSPAVVLDCLQVFQREDPKLAKRLDRMLRSATPQQSQSRTKSKQIIELYIPGRDIMPDGVSLVQGKHMEIGLREEVEHNKQINLNAEDIFTQTKRKLLDSWKKEAEEQKEQENQLFPIAVQLGQSQRFQTPTLLHRANQLSHDKHNQHYNFEQSQAAQLINSPNKPILIHGNPNKSFYSNSNMISRRQSTSMDKRPATRSTFYERFNKKLLDSRRFSSQCANNNNSWYQQNVDSSEENMHNTRLDGVEQGLKSEQNWATSSVLESAKECEKLVAIFVNKSIISEDTLWKQRKQRMQKEQLHKSNPHHYDFHLLNQGSHELQQSQEISQIQHDQEHFQHSYGFQSGNNKKQQQDQIPRSRIFKQVSKESQQLYQKLVTQHLRS